MIATLAAAALAQGSPSPQVAADPLRMALDGGPFLASDGAGADGFVAAARLSWAHRPLVFDPDDGPADDLLVDVVAVHLGASVRAGPLRVGLTAPAYLVASGASWDGQAPLLGDPILGAKLSACLTRGPNLILGLVGRAGAPLGASRRQLGYGGVFGEIGGLVALDAGPLHLALNSGVRFEPVQDLGAQLLDDAWWLRAGVAVDLSEAWVPAIEITGQRPLDGFVRGTGPLEGLIELRHRRPSGVAVEVALGRGLSSGIGAPEWRGVVGITYGSPTQPPTQGG